MSTDPPLITEYLADLAFAGASPATIRVRRQVLRHVARDVGPLYEASPAVLKAWLARPLAPESRRAYRSHLRAYCTWLIDQGHLTVNPTDRIPNVKVPRRLPRPIDEDDLQRALAHADRRMRAWLLLMALEGLRCIEVAALEPRDLYLPEVGPPLLILRVTKGSQQATVPLHPDVLTALNQLPARGGVWWSCSANRVSEVVNRHLHDCGVTATAHQLRHYAATTWYRASGHDLLTTARLLRHKSVASTQVYAALDPLRPAEVLTSVSIST